MLTKKYKSAVIFNPIAGGGKYPDLPNYINKYLNTDFFDCKIFTTQRSEDIKFFIQKILDKEYELIIVAGGDGTLNQVLQFIVNKNIILAHIPIGSGNGFAGHFKFDKNIKQIIKSLHTFKIKKIDIGKVNDYYFLSTAGLGFDAHIAKLFAESKKRGKYKYLELIIKEIFSYKEKRYKIFFNNKKLSVNANLITFANTSQFGNNVLIAPDANPFDGKLNLCIISGNSICKKVIIFLKLMLKKINKSKNYLSYKSNKVIINSNDTIMHIDGEIIDINGYVEIKIISNALNFLLP